MNLNILRFISLAKYNHRYCFLHEINSRISFHHNDLLHSNSHSHAGITSICLPLTNGTQPSSSNVTITIHSNERKASNSLNALVYSRVAFPLTPLHNAHVSHSALHVNRLFSPINRRIFAWQSYKRDH